MTDENDRRLAKLYVLMDDGEWKEECMGIVLLNMDTVVLLYCSQVQEEGDQMIEIHKVGEIQQVLRQILIHPDIVYQENDSKWILQFLMRRVSDPVVGR